MNKIIYNLNTYQLIEIDFSQILVVGQENAINIDLYFKNGDVFKVDTDWQVWLTFERPDGESTNITLATLNNDHYSKKIGSWFTAVDGIGKIFTIIKVNGETIAPFAVAKVQIFEGGTPSDDTISQEQYNELLSNINDVNNKLENHINDKNNPHEVTPEQLNVYEKEHVNDIAEQVDENKTDISTLKTDMGAINGLRTDVNKNTNDISNLDGRVSTNENNIASLGGRLLTAEQEILLRAKTSEVVAMINSHDNDIEAHQYILRLIAAVSAGGVKPLVFDTEAELVEWLESGTIVHQGFTPDMLELGQLLYTIPEDELDYWVSVLPVNELSDLTPLQGMVDLSAYALLTDLDAIMFSLDGVLSSVGILETIKVDKVDGKELSSNDYTNNDKTLVGTIPDKVDKVEGKGLSTNDFTDADKLEVGKIANKVDKVTGKELSTNDYTNNDKALVDTIINKQNMKPNGTDLLIDPATNKINYVYTNFDVDLFIVVPSLPTTGVANKIYLVPKTPAVDNVYDEYIWVNNAWELIGEMSVNLTDYYTKTQIDNLLNLKQTELNAELSQVYGGKNLAFPDLQGKEYLGDGVYRLHIQLGATIDYNIYSGIYTVNKPITTAHIQPEIFNIGQFNGVITVIYVGGETTNLFTLLRYIPSNGNIIYFQYDTKTSVFQSPINNTGVRIYLADNEIYENYQFKIQLEQGDTATPYTLPIQPVIYHETKYLETSKQNKLVAGDNITINPVTNVISASGSGGGGSGGDTIEVLTDHNNIVLTPTTNYTIPMANKPKVIAFEMLGQNKLAVVKDFMDTQVVAIFNDTILDVNGDIGNAGDIFVLHSTQSINVNYMSGELIFTFDFVNSNDINITQGSQTSDPFNEIHVSNLVVFGYE